MARLPVPQRRVGPPTREFIYKFGVQQAWQYRGAYGWVYHLEEGWHSSPVHGYLYLYFDGNFGYWSNLKSYTWGKGGTTIYTWALQWTTPTESTGRFWTNTLGYAFVGEFEGWVYSPRAGWIYPYGDGVYFYSPVYGWVAADGLGNLYATGLGVYL